MKKRLLKNDKTSFIAGGGRFGTEALKYLIENNYEVIVADPDKNCRARNEINEFYDDLKEIDYFKNKKSKLIKGNASKILLKIIKDLKPNIVVPATPGHFLAKFVQKRIKKMGYETKPAKEITTKLKKKIPKELINKADIKNGTIITSYMREEMLCKSNCRQPPDICPKTGITKENPMYEILRNILSELDFRHRVFRSEQLTDGVGGVKGKRIINLLEDELKDTNHHFAIGTSCSCHGVLTILEVDN